MYLRRVCVCVWFVCVCVYVCVVWCGVCVCECVCGVCVCVYVCVWLRTGARDLWETAAHKCKGPVGNRSALEQGTCGKPLVIPAKDMWEASPHKCKVLVGKP